MEINADLGVSVGEIVMMKKTLHLKYLYML